MVSTTTPALHVLAQADVDAFRREGYYIASALFGADEIAQIRTTFMDMNARGPVEGLSETQHFGSPSGYSPTDPLAFYPRMLHPHRHPDKPVGPLSMRYMLDRRVGDILRDLMSDEPIAAQSMFYFKPPGARGQDFHQDNFYLRVQPGTCTAAWVTIDDCDQENGAMMVVPESARLELLCPKEADRSISFTSHHVDIPEGMRLVPMNLKAGDVLFFNGAIIHGSRPNQSKTRFRRSFICHYVPESCIEVSNWYRPLLRFDGSVVEKLEATGGGPCGEAQAAVKGPH